VLALIPGLLIIGYFSHQILWYKLSKQYPAYRIENYPFSWSIAKRHPFFGIGLRAPRTAFLEDYQVEYKYSSKEEFAKVLAEIKTPDNIFLTFIAEMGLPFTILYLAAVMVLLFKLMRMVFHPPPGLIFPPLVLAFPLAVALVHYQLYDGLLFSQNSWFFHILLGLIPVGERKIEEQAATIAA
jgi:O-antigen ligase